MTAYESFASQRDGHVATLTLRVKKRAKLHRSVSFSRDSNGVTRLTLSNNTQQCLTCVRREIPPLPGTR